MRPTQGVEAFGNNSSLLFSLAKFYENRPKGTPQSEALNARWVAKYGDFEPVEGYISRTVQDTASGAIND